MGAENSSFAVAVINTPFCACNKDNPPLNTLERGKSPKPSAKEEPVEKKAGKIKKGIPKAVYIVTGNASKSKEIVAKAMADMYKRMINPI